jgi:hypothetical protein
MVPVASIGNLGMKRDCRVVDQGLKKFLHQFRIKIPDLPAPEDKVINQTGSAREVYMDRSQAFVHGYKGRSVPADSLFSAESLLERTAQANPDILDSMVVIDLRISPSPQGQVKKSMGAKKGQHMIEKGNGTSNPVFPRSIQVQFNLNLRLLGFSLYFALPHHVLSLL